jgi:hypothetical protein
VQRFTFGRKTLDVVCREWRMRPRHSVLRRSVPMRRLSPTVRRSVDYRRTDRRRVADLCVAAADCCTTGTNSAGEPCWVKEFTNVRLGATSRPQMPAGKSLDDVTAGSLLQRRSASRGNKHPSAQFSTTDGKSTEVSQSPPTVSGASLSRCSAAGQV